MGIHMSKKEECPKTRVESISKIMEARGESMLLAMEVDRLDGLHREAGRALTQAERSEKVDSPELARCKRAYDLAGQKVTWARGRQENMRERILGLVSQYVEVSEREDGRDPSKALNDEYVRVRRIFQVRLMVRPLYLTLEQPRDRQKPTIDTSVGWLMLHWRKSDLKTIIQKFSFEFMKLPWTAIEEPRPSDRELAIQLLHFALNGDN